MSDISQNIIEYPWGKEIVWANDSEYTAKFVILNNNCKTPFLMSEETSKTFFVNAGKCIFSWIDTTTGEIFQQEANEGTVWKCNKLQPYSIKSLQDQCSLTEINNGNNNTLVILNTGMF